MRSIASRTTHAMAAWVYILTCSDRSYYVGCTTALDNRFAEHQAGTYPGYTSTRRPVIMAWAAEFQTIHDAIDFERKLKRWSRAKKEAVIRDDWDSLPRLSRRGFRPATEVECVVRDAPQSGAPHHDKGG